MDWYRLKKHNDWWNTEHTFLKLQPMILSQQFDQGTCLPKKEGSTFLKTPKEEQKEKRPEHNSLTKKRLRLRLRGRNATHRQQRSETRWAWRPRPLRPQKLVSRTIRHSQSTLDQLESRGKHSCDITHRYPDVWVGIVLCVGRLDCRLLLFNSGQKPPSWLVLTAYFTFVKASRSCDERTAAYLWQRISFGVKCWTSG